MTILQWACSHTASSTHSTKPHLDTDHTCSTTPHATESAHLCVDSTTHPITSLIKDFPITLTLLKEERQLKETSDSAQYHAAIERWDWGPLVSHCTSSYWECLSAYLKYVSSLPPAPKCDGRLTIGSSDVIGIAKCCISSLDVAAFSVGVVIEAVSTLVPKVLLTEDLYSCSVDNEISLVRILMNYKAIITFIISTLIRFDDKIAQLLADCRNRFARFRV